MNPAPQGRPLAVWKAKRDTIAHCGDDISWLPPMPPPAAHYPPVYYEATLAETLLVTRFRTVMSIRHMPLYHKKYRGHTIAFMQDLSDFVGRVSVPIRFDTLAFWIVRVQHDQGRKHQDYRVRKAVVIELLKWLPMLLTDAYSDVSWPMRENIDEEQLNRLPDDDYIYDVLPHSLYDNDDAGGGSSASATGPMMAEYVSGAEMDMDSSGFVGRPPAETNSAAAGRAVETMGGRAVGAKPLPWATACSQAECEWKEGYVVRAFPLRFTVEHADLNDDKRVKGGQQTQHEHRFERLSPEDYFQSLLFFWDGYTHCYPFANDPRFKYLAFNLAMRRRTLSKANVFTRQLPAGTTVEQVLWQFDNDNDFTIQKLQARVADLKGTAQYIIAQRAKMCCWVLNGLVEQSCLPHIFLTTSEVELHDPFLHALLDKALPSAADVSAGRAGTYHGQVQRYHDADPPPSDGLLRRKLAVRDNLHVVTDYYVRKTLALHHFVLQPLFDLSSFALRTEFAQRRTMSHTHELLRLRHNRTGGCARPEGAPAHDPNARPPVPTMEMCFAAIRDPTGDDARQIVAFAAWLTLTAIHPAASRDEWPEDFGGGTDDATVTSVGNRALRRTFASLSSADERAQDEVILVNRVLCHKCGTYCLKPVVSRRTGKPVHDDTGQPKKACRFRPEEKEEHSCHCPHCDADLASSLRLVDSCPACEERACDCGAADCGCKTVVWQLPHTFRFELRYCRNLGRLQVHVRPLTHAVRGNYDIQFVIDYTSVIDYIVKYIGKPEGRSDTFRNLMKNVFKTASSDATMTQLCAAAMNEVIGKRDFSDTEVSHLLNQLPIVEFSDVFSNIFNMTVRRGLAKPPAEGEEVDSASVGVLPAVEEWYTCRFPDLEAKSSYELLQEHQGKDYAKFEGGKLVPQYLPFNECSLPPSNVDERYPEEQISKLLRKSEDYAQQRLVMFKPYRDRQRDLKADALSWMEALDRWLAAAAASENEFARKAAKAVKYELDAYSHRQELIEEMEMEQDEPETSEDEAPMDDEADVADDDPTLLLSRLYPDANVDADLQNSLLAEKDWTATIRPLQPLNESELPWISEQRDLLGDELPPNYSAYNPEHLKEYPEQRFAYELVRSHAERIFSPTGGGNEPVLLMIVDGAGGCGKSHVLHCIVKEINRLATAAGHEGVPVRVCAPTGSAASLVYGSTIHSFIRWNPAHPFAELKCAAETEWQEQIRGLRYLLIDERSLLSQQLLSYLQSRLRQGKPAQRDQPSAGISIILFGDDFQLPPTNGGRLYAEPYYTFRKQRTFSAERERVRRLFLDHFSTCVQLVTNVRAKGATLAQAQWRSFQMDCLRPCAPTQEWLDYVWEADLNRCQPEERQRWMNKFRLCSTNEERAKHNGQMLVWTSQQLREPITTIRAEHPRGGHVARRASAKQAQGLLPELVLCVGARVSLNWNGWVSRSIVNGLKGVVLEIVYHHGEGPPALPLVVFVACTRYRGESYDDTHQVAPSPREDEIMGFAGLRAGQAGVIAVQPISRTWQAGDKVPCERKQLPLEVAFAVSIHKGQGMTIGDGEDIEEAVLDIGKTELDLGMSYVGFSRFKAHAAMKVIRPSWDRFQNIGAKRPSDAKFATLQARNTEASRVSQLVAATKVNHAEIWQQCVQWAATRESAAHAVDDPISDSDADSDGESTD